MALPLPAQAAADLVARYYETFNGGDRPAFLALLTADVVHDLNQGGREIGSAAFAAFLARMDRCYREQIREVRVTVSADGTHAAAEYVVHGAYLSQDEGLPPATGQTYVLPGGAFFDLRGGKVARISNHYNLQHWLAQIGAGGTTA